MPSNLFAAYLCYDPRDPAQHLENRDTWKRSTNGILIAATMLYTSRDNIPISWDKVAALADMSEEADVSPAAEARPPTATIDETNAMLRGTLAKRQADFA